MVIHRISILFSQFCAESPERMQELEQQIYANFGQFILFEPFSIGECEFELRVYSQ